jgi:AraC-like DNA-binding protein
MENYEKRGYLLENFRLFHLRTEQHGPINYHYHEFCKLVLLVSGSGYYTVDGRRYRLLPGDAVLVGSRCVHRPEMEEGQVYERIILYIAPEYLRRESEADCDLEEIFTRSPVLRLRDPEKLLHLMQELEKELQREGYGRGVLASAALLRLLVFVARQQRGEMSLLPQSEAPRNPRVTALMAYIDENLAEDLDIDALAERFYVSKFHMMRQFRLETGMTVYTYLQQRRLLHARDLIRAGKRATEACYSSGWRSYSSFTRAYAKFFGTTPTGRADTAAEREEGYE